MSIPWWANGENILSNLSDLPWLQIWPIDSSDIYPTNPLGQIPTGTITFEDTRPPIYYRIGYNENVPAIAPNWPVEAFDNSYPIGMPTLVYVVFAATNADFDDDDAIIWRYYDESPSGFVRINDFYEFFDPIYINEIEYQTKCKIEVKNVYIPLKITYTIITRDNNGNIINEENEVKYLKNSISWQLILEPAEDEEFINIRIYRALPFIN